MPRDLPLRLAGMSDRDSDPTANTAAFQAFTEKADTEQPRSKSGVTVTVIVLAALVAAGAIAYLMLG